MSLWISARRWAICPEEAGTSTLLRIETSTATIRPKASTGRARRQGE